MTEEYLRETIKFIMDFEMELHRLQELAAKQAAEIEKLSAFKAYVHKRLDDAGVPADPESPHKAEGCRIGGRLDLVLNIYQIGSPDPAFFEFLDQLKIRVKKGIADRNNT